MIRKTATLFCVFLSAVLGAQQPAPETPAFTETPVDYVNPLMGTDSDFDLSTGNVYPAIALPWGMNFWTPQTGEMGSGWTYTYNARKIRGFKQTHQPSPWMNDYGQFSIMPVSDSLRFTEEERASWFSHKAEVSTPYYYKVFLADHNITTEITPTERAACFRIHYRNTDAAYLVLDAFDKGSYVKVIPEERRIIGYTTKNSGGVPENFRNYFVLEFDRDIASAQTFDGDSLQSGLSFEGNHAGAVVRFRTSGKSNVVALKVASSFISAEQAERNLEEVKDLSFDQVADKGKEEWNRVLGKIQVSGGSEDQVKTFYSCLYRSLLFPRKFYEYDGNGDPIHYSPYNGKVLPGYMFTDTGFWDTFRALFPMMNLVYADMAAKMQQGLVNAYKESGWLPEWASPGLRNIMIGNNSASVVADGYYKLHEDHTYDINTLFEALENGAHNEGPLDAVGRKGAPYYNDLGYLPYDSGINQNVSRTLEYAYNDFTIYRLARALNKPDSIVEHYRQRSLNYRNLFDPETGFMRPRAKDGRFRREFNPIDWSRDFTEGNSMHYSWSVFHDIQGYIDLLGGEEAFARQLDTVFHSPSTILPRKSGRPIIHEMREMQVADMGQYAHGNQPAQHMIYLYNYVGQPWKTQYWIRETLNRMYTPAPDGYCGDEDNGQTSAWYVFSALGFYPVCPGVDEYVLGAPLFRNAWIHLDNGKTITITAPENSDENRYISGLKVNGRKHTANYLDFGLLKKGARLDFEMSPDPDTRRGTRKKDYPYSLSNRE
ncbi:GH92 family glycosyl hydrolase [Sinomicrobium soli]|uniref:GH92 family glycosyl hydrolase n=1 Tax=Sinomicrobium sp. N-1-3-6 TaxID=2219864 RepID=UPI000DCBC2BE|nr:GH92 family glycosyl hydrolase [Sinomicrobium sp. N-1-3-6]RAV27734.1 glycoside hydrolase family 92 protein [Sinomicrobium sp. N-1-3-6]